MSKKFRLLMALVAGIVAAILVVIIVGQAENEARLLVEPQAVVVATRDITPGRAITATDLTIQEVPARYVQPASLNDLAEVLDRIAIVGIREGEQITQSKIVSAAREPLANYLPAGTRGIAVAVSEVSGVAGLVEPGDRVDVIGIFQLGARAEDLVIQAHVLLQNVLVVARGQELGQGDGLFMDEQSGALDRVSTVTLALQPEQAQQIVLAQHLGDLTLMLHGRRETSGDFAYEVLDPQKLLGTDLRVWSEALEEAEFRRQMMQEIRR